MHRYFIELAYNGTRYHGWQIQPNASSLQEELEGNLSKICRTKVALTGAGRTDTGVHASYFVAHFDLEQAVSALDNMCYKLNKMLPSDVVIYRIYPVPSNLHARFDATYRTYFYYISRQKNPFATETAFYYPQQLQLDAMNAAAQRLFAYTDFTSFSKLHTQVKTNNCKILRAEWLPTASGCVFVVQADRFLRNMVRAMVGSMLDVGRQKITPDDFATIIEQKDRGKAGTSAQARGLFLADIGYPVGSEPHKLNLGFDRKPRLV